MRSPVLLASPGGDEDSAVRSPRATGSQQPWPSRRHSYYVRLYAYYPAELILPLYKLSSAFAD
ncbi:MAG: hypothetical protein KME26_33490 [Oscillatoria princeps RMCB-10]|nr:hypothetical protein [Oscillatoria princeps RMCB-10]